MSPITEVEGRRLALSNLEKVLFPETGTTKGELLHYVATTAGALLAHVHDRPMSFLRFPDGVGGEVFFTKNPPPGKPVWVKTVEVSRSEGATARQVVVGDLSTLMWAANLVVEFHVPQWRVGSEGVADRMVFDLDPGEPAGMAECCEVALWLRARLESDGFGVWVKTSGSKGLHVLVPVEPTASERVTAYAKEVAKEAEAVLPGVVVARMARAARVGRVFVDFSQNSASKTTAAAYSVRARRGATVSTPVTWEEVEDPSRELAFGLDDVVGRLELYGDLLGPLLNPNRARGVPGVG
ncbi:non-homologous end-joining DNA ligase [Streptomyces sp. NBC_00237]|uniref:non-homologous end-joining DNA ligase n=1 Tax=Streptomyces sp. NBC_00237 TaxID=2975687 RepID=UPI00224E67C3|nr:non-homologous end-joining DNA ligase [Streptomyces sp. NBC_00237]MCX5204216.1 non-homologous end-joining DNA ligase [Streptomyces sp. NBC_00237]